MDQGEKVEEYGYLKMTAKKLMDLWLAGQGSEDRQTHGRKCHTSYLTFSSALGLFPSHPVCRAPTSPNPHAGCSCVVQCLVQSVMVGVESVHESVPVRLGSKSRNGRKTAVGVSEKRQPPMQTSKPLCLILVWTGLTLRKNEASAQNSTTSRSQRQ